MEWNERKETKRKEGAQVAESKIINTIEMCSVSNKNEKKKISQIRLIENLLLYASVEFKA